MNLSVALSLKGLASAGNTNDQWHDDSITIREMLLGKSFKLKVSTRK